MTGTANPDFSQIESDAGQLLFDPRDERFFQEKRPFFLDGIEQFTTPNNLVYSRRVVQPVAAAKLTGKAFGTNLALLSAVDDPDVLHRPATTRSTTSSGSSATSAPTRGSAWSTPTGSRATTTTGCSAPTRGCCSAGSTPCSSRRPEAARAPGGVVTNAPLWQARFTRNGRTFGFSTSINASDEEFRARSGFFPRPGLVHLNFRPRVTVYGEPGSMMESATFDVNLNGRWRYDEFVGGDGIMDEQLHFNVEHHVEGRLEPHRVAAAGDLRLSLRDLRRVPGRAARHRRRRGHGGVRRPAPDPQPGLRALVRDAGVQAFLRQRVRPVGQRRELLRVVARPDHHLQLRPDLAAHRQAAAGRHLCAPAGRAG